MVCNTTSLYILNSSERTPTTEERAVSASSSSTIAKATDRSSAHGYVSKKSVNKAAYVRLHSELAAGYSERMVPSVVAKIASITDFDGSDESKDGS